MSSQFVNLTLSDLDKYLKILDRIIPFRIENNDYEEIEHHEDDVERIKVIKQIVVDRYSKLLKPIVSIDSIIKAGKDIISGNSCFTLAFISKHFIILHKIDPVNTPYSIPVVLKPSDTENRIDVFSIATENIALKDASLLFKRYEYMGKRLENIRDIAKNSNNDSRQLSEDFLNLTRIQTINAVCFLSRIHSFLDMFCNRVKELKEKTKPSETWIKKPLVCKLDRLFKQEGHYNKNIIKDYNELRNNITHSNSYTYLVNNLPSTYKKLKSVAENYTKIARDLWKHLFNNTYPEYIPLLSLNAHCLLNLLRFVMLRQGTMFGS